MLLAREGKAAAADLRFAQKSPRQAALARAQLGAALESVGESQLAEGEFAEAARMLVEPKSSGYRWITYGSQVRDTYAVAATMASVGKASLVPPLLQKAQGLDRDPLYTSTQEKAWMLLAVAEMARHSGTLAIQADGRPLKSGDPVQMALSQDQMAAGVRLRNAGEGEVSQTISIEGMPKNYVPPADNGMRVSKAIHTLDGAPADLATVKRNDRLVIVIEGAVTNQVNGEYAVLDLLPPGFEIETVLRQVKAGYDWVGNLSRQVPVQEARDDRFVAAMTMPLPSWDDGGYREYWKKVWDFRVAYVVRAVTPGEYAMPAVVTEHMYQPRIRARSAMSRLVVQE
jgi:alpha-2-macroglobulin